MRYFNYKPTLFIIKFKISKQCLVLRCNNQCSVKAINRALGSINFMSDLSIIIGDIRPDLIREETLPDLFKQTVAQYPDKTALIFHDENA